MKLEARESRSVSRGRRAQSCGLPPTESNCRCLAPLHYPCLLMAVLRAVGQYSILLVWSILKLVWVDGCENGNSVSGREGPVKNYHAIRCFLVEASQEVESRREQTIPNEAEFLVDKSSQRMHVHLPRPSTKGQTPVGEDAGILVDVVAFLVSDQGNNRAYLQTCGRKEPVSKQ